jgi:hypothetical protein
MQLVFSRRDEIPGAGAWDSEAADAAKAGEPIMR